MISKCLAEYNKKGSAVFTTLPNYNEINIHLK